VIQITGKVSHATMKLTFTRKYGAAFYPGSLVITQSSSKVPKTG